VTHGDIVANEDIRTRYTAIADASAIVGSHATRAQGTIGGNVMNASPAMDTGGRSCASARPRRSGRRPGERSIALDELWTGPGRRRRARRAARRARRAAPAAGTGSCYVRLEYRRQMEIAVVGATAVVTVEGGRIVGARVAITALTPTIRRVPEAESALAGTDGAATRSRPPRPRPRRPPTPISDVRGSAEYRRAMAAVIANRAITAALTRARGGSVPIPASPALHGAS
jgi:CO/xanthine dehydrogenase FAD-binding subunit